LNGLEDHKINAVGQWTLDWRAAPFGSAERKSG
jgi:hypothetical protein